MDGFDPMDFFNPLKKLPKIVLQAPDFYNYRPSAYDEPPPESDLSLFCPDSEWKEYIEAEGRKLAERAAESVHGTSEVGTVVRSDMDGIEGRTEATKTVVANDLNEDSINLREMFDFNNNPEAWKLPIIDHKERILEMIQREQIVIISGPTGCGKSTQVPQYILDKHAIEKKLVNIVVTQPRKIAASSVARRVCQERGWKLGGLVGYQVGLDRANKSQDTRLLYVTTGVLKRQIIAKKNLNNYTHIILDEVHEREEDMDLVLLLCKKLLFTNSRGTKLVLMSATLNEKKLSSYFTSMLSNGLEVPPPVVNIELKKNAHVQDFFLDDLRKLMKENSLDDGDLDFERPNLNHNLILLCKMIIKSIEQLEAKYKAAKGTSGEAGAVLVFLPGLAEIQMVKDILTEDDHMKSDILIWHFYCLHSSVSWEEQQSVYEVPPPGTRKIILATNIAESSLTIPDIQYVIDFCLTKNLQTDKDSNYPRLMLDWACQNQMVQRRGRAGRVSKEGRCFKLIPKNMYWEQPEDSVPEMLRIPLANVVLDVKMLDMGSPKQLLALAMDPPDIQNLLRAILNLKELGALLTTVNGVAVKDDGDLTVMGEIIARLPMEINLGKMIVLGHIFGVLEDTIIIAAGLNGKSIFTSPFERRVQAYKTKIKWASRTFSDCFAILHAYQAWFLRKSRGEFSSKMGGRAAREKELHYCKQAFLQMKSLHEMNALVDEVTKILSFMKIEPLKIQSPVQWPKDTKDLVLRIVFFGAFYPNYFTKQVSSEVEFNAHKVLLGKDPKTTVYLQGMNDEHSPFGPIYSGQIRKLFQDCSKNEEKIDLTFDGRKIFVEFLRDDITEDWKVQSTANEDKNLTGEVHEPVYVAIKLRNQGSARQGSKKLSINLYGTKEMAEAKHEEWQETVKKLQQMKLTSNEVEQVPPPGKDQEILTIEKVTHISSPSMFWVQTTDNQDKDERLLSIISQVLVQCPAVKKDVKVGDLTLAPYKEPGDEEIHFYRGRINSIQGEAAHVFFIDFGNVEVVSLKNLREIPSAVIKKFPDLLTIPGLALECCLASLQPNKLRNAKGLWDDEPIKLFKEYVFSHCGGPLKSRIFSVTKSGSSHNKFVVVLENLEVRTPDNVIDVKKALISRKLADVAVESFLSQEDHRERARFSVYDSAMKKHMGSAYSSSLTTPFLKSMREDQSMQPIRLCLQGPFSPLEHKVLCAYRNGSTKLTNVDPESVNSILLDQTPSDLSDQWMVAAHVALSASGESLTIRNTSWMPSKPGLGAICTMIFAPQVELRVNPDKTRIIGFLAGLGPKTIWDKPLETVTRVERTHAYYPEHDLEVKLDVELSNSDINIINKVRFWINQMMVRSEDGLMQLTQPKHLDAAQRGIQRNLDDLFKRERKPVDKTCVPCGHEYRWNMLKSSQRIQSQAASELFFYKMIDGVRLNQIRDNQAELEKLIKLYSMMDELSTSPLPYHEVCPVCPGQLSLTTPRDLFHHFNSDQHKAEETLVTDTPDTLASSSCAGSNVGGGRR